MADLTPERAALLGRIGSATLHSRYDSREITAPARKAFLDKFLDEVDPERVLPQAERLRRAKHARSAHFARMALARHDAARKRKATTGATA
jgi:hypothetical protein